MRFHEMTPDVLAILFNVPEDKAVGLLALFFAAFMAGMRRDNAGIIQEYMRDQPEAAIPGVLDALRCEYAFGLETNVDVELEKTITS